MGLDRADCRFFCDLSEFLIIPHCAQSIGTSINFILLHIRLKHGINKIFHLYFYLFFLISCQIELTIFTHFVQTERFKRHKSDIDHSSKSIGTPLSLSLWIMTVIPLLCLLDMPNLDISTQVNGKESFRGSVIEFSQAGKKSWWTKKIETTPPNKVFLLIVGRCCALVSKSWRILRHACFELCGPRTITNPSQSSIPAHTGDIT